MTTILKSSTPARGRVGERQIACQPILSAPRIHYFDWLRALAVFGIVAYHSVLPFARDTWHIVNDQRSPILLAFLFVLKSFGIGVLFLIAGASVRFALQRQSTRAFLSERAVRLLVPYVVSAIVLVPPTAYIAALQQGSVSGSLLAYLGEYPRLLWFNCIVPKGFSPEVLANAGMHLWFMAWLFMCLALPVFAFLASSAGRSIVDWLGRMARWPGAVLLLGVPMAVPRIILSALPMEQTGRANMLLRKRFVLKPCPMVAHASMTRSRCTCQFRVSFVAPR